MSLSVLVLVSRRLIKLTLPSRIVFIGSQSQAFFAHHSLQPQRCCHHPTSWAAAVLLSTLVPAVDPCEPPARQRLQGTCRRHQLATGDSSTSPFLIQVRDPANRAFGGPSGPLLGNCTTLAQVHVEAWLHGDGREEQRTDTGQTGSSFFFLRCCTLPRVF